MRRDACNKHARERVTKKVTVVESILLMKRKNFAQVFVLLCGNLIAVKCPARGTFVQTTQE